ncbi:hypothetical protein AgCh_001737 [Apium graveolens]
MAKKNVKSSNSRNSTLVDTQTETTNWVATGLLDSRDSLQSFMKREIFEEAKILFHSNVIAVISYSSRTLACLDAIDGKHHLGIDVEVMKYYYCLKKFSSFRIGFSNRNIDGQLILNKDYFFVEKKPLGDDANYLFDHPDFEPDQNITSARVTVEKIRALAPGERIWPNCLGRPIWNVRTVDVDDFVAKVKKKLVIRDEESEDSPKSIKGVEMSTGHFYAKALSETSVDSIMSGTVGYSFNTLESIMVAREVYNHDMKRLKKLEDDDMKCASKIQAAEKLAFNNLKAMKDVQNELEEFASKYHRGGWSSWDVPETVKIYNEVFPDDAFPMDEFGGATNDGDKAKSPKGDAREDTWQNPFLIAFV